MTADTVKSDGIDLTLAPEERPAAPPGKPARRLRRSWGRMRFRVGGSLGEATTATAVPASSEEQADAQPTRPQKHKKSWREQIVVITVYWGVKSGLAALGTTPTALIQGIKAAISSRGGGT
jgi:hypothetical protein